jgi:hypothetical protein
MKNAESNIQHPTSNAVTRAKSVSEKVFLRRHGPESGGGSSAVPWRDVAKTRRGGRLRYTLSLAVRVAQEVDMQTSGTEHPRSSIWHAIAAPRRHAHGPLALIVRRAWARLSRGASRQTGAIDGPHTR